MPTFSYREVYFELLDAANSLLVFDIPMLCWTAKRLHNPDTMLFLGEGFSVRR
jgi:hypothetical protein